MQSGRNAAEATKEKAADLAASARSGMEKTKATFEEKAERMTTRDPLRKELATEKKYDKQDQAELEKQQAYDHHAAARQTVEATRHTTHATTGPGGTTGYTAHVTGGTAPGYGAGYTDYSTGTGTGTAPGYGAGQYTTAGTVPGYTGHVTSGTGATTGYGSELAGRRTAGADEVPDPNYPIGTEPAPRHPPGPDYHSTGRTY